MNRIVHFEFNSPDPAKSNPFFESVFGWNIQKWGDEQYWLCATGSGDGIDGATMQSRDNQPRTVCAIQVDSVDASIEKIKAAGGTIVVPKFPVPTVGWVAYFTDPAGVLAGVYQHDPSAGS